MTVDRRNFMNNYKPVILGFLLATFTSVSVVFIGMRDSINANLHYQATGNEYRTRFDNHIGETRIMEGRIRAVEQSIQASTETGRELKDLLRRNEEMLMKVNVTLTQTSTVALTEIENINKRLDKAGL